MFKHVFCFSEEALVSCATSHARFWINHLEHFVFTWFAIFSWIEYFHLSWKSISIFVEMSGLECFLAKDIDCGVMNLLWVRVFVMHVGIHRNFAELFLDRKYVADVRCRLRAGGQSFVNSSACLQTSSVWTAQKCDLCIFNAQRH